MSICVFLKIIYNRFRLFCFSIVKSCMGSQNLSKYMFLTDEITECQACKEIQYLAKHVSDLFGQVRALSKVTTEKESELFFREVKKLYNAIIYLKNDLLFGLKVLQKSICESRNEIYRLQAEVQALSDIAKSCKRLAASMHRELDLRKNFTKRQQEHLGQMLQFANESLLQMLRVLQNTTSDIETDLSFSIETEINNFCIQLKNQNFMDIKSGEYSNSIGAFYIELIGECEILANYVQNVVNAHMK